jgi:7,8-dihydropterin-6-yl-methyl-4-(beta-D-ribofuranosyl)aminobenzene 5'-phosphate synthase
MVAEHGFALWIETPNQTIVFDTGHKDAFLPNLQALDLDLSKVSDLVLSHGHYDHTGGVDAVLDQAKGIKVHVHQAAFQPRYSRKEEATRSIRMPSDSLRALGRLNEDEIHWATRADQIGDDVGITGPIPRISDFEDTGGSFYYDEGAKRPDPIDDDLAIWLNTAVGLVVCVGCSHAGIVNTARAVLEHAEKDAIHTIVGGLHLLNASEERLESTVEALNGLGVQRLVACHCTGDLAISYLDTHMDGEVVRGHAGFSLVFDPPS